MRKRITILTAALLITALLLPLATGCDSGTKEEKDIATQVAKDWTDDSIETVAFQITSLATGLALGVSGIPGVTDALSSAVEQQISDNITWTYSTPLKIGDNEYQVVAEATSGIDLPAVGNYEVTVEVTLTIDTENEEVTNWSIYTDSFHFTDIGPGSSDPLTLVFGGWHVENSLVTTAGKNDMVTAKLSLSNGNDGTYTLRIVRDISQADDETVTDLSFDYDGDSATKEISFIPPYATGESSTNGYLLHLLYGDTTIWTMKDEYPPRLIVNS